MANRRMFSKQIIDTDLFLNMPITSQCLYFHLSLRADDEGFINNPRRVSRMLGANEDDLKVLIGRQFLIEFESGVVVIKHWHIHNYIRKDRFKQTINGYEKSQITLNSDDIYERYTNGQPNDDQRLPQVRLGKVRLGKDNIYIGEQAHRHIDEGSSNKSYEGEVVDTLNDDHSKNASCVEAKAKTLNGDHSKSASYVGAYKQVIDYLNKKANSNYKHTSKSNQSHIRARINEGYTIDDFKKVIDIKCDEWLGTDWEKYLRPNTLFGTKFECYLNQKAKTKSANRKDYSHLISNRD